MLVLVETEKEKRQLLRLLVQRLKNGLKRTERRKVDFYGGGRVRVFHNETIWWWTGGIQRVVSPRPTFRNAFGFYNRPSPEILPLIAWAVIPMSDNKRDCSGFFARDTESGEAFLFHSGRFAAPFSKEGFFVWSGLKLFQIIDQMGSLREGFFICQVNSNSVVPQISRFIEKVSDYKNAQERGKLDSADFRKNEEISSVLYHKYLYIWLQPRLYYAA